MRKLKYNDIELCIVDGLTFNNSMKEVKYDDIECDFEGFTKVDLPVKFQEIQILDEITVKAYGYISSYKYDGITKKITFEVLSPKSYITNRITSLNVTGLTLDTAVQSLVNSLLIDGYSVVGSLSSDIVTESMIFQPIDKLLDYLAEKYKFVWYCDELKVIHFIMEDELKNQTPIYSFTENSPIQLETSIDSKEYFNTVYAKNLLVYYQSASDTDAKPIMVGYQTINANEEVTFTNWVDISKTVGEKLENGTDTIQLLSIYNGSVFFNITYKKSTKTYAISSNLGFEGIDDNNPSKPILLKRHEFYKNIITGFKVQSNQGIETLVTDSALRQAVIKYTNINEVNNNKGKISTSGIIEKYIDLKNRWFTVNEITEYIKNLIASNSIQAEIIKLTVKGDDINEFENINIGNTVIIKNDEHLIDNTYVIVSIDKRENYTIKEIQFECRNANFLDNFISMFRTPFEQESDSQMLYEINSTYIANTINIVNEYTAKGEVINEN